MKIASIVVALLTVHGAAGAQRPVPPPPVRPAPAAPIAKAPKAPVAPLRSEWFPAHELTEAMVAKAMESVSHINSASFPALWSEKLAAQATAWEAVAAMPAIAPMAELATMQAMESFNHDFNFDFDFAHKFAPSVAFEQDWQQPDPADSLYRVAYESMNRGDWRRAADLFAQIPEKYPRSRRLLSAAYYEAFMNYRIGSLESLRNAYKILTEKAKGPTTSATAAEIASLTTRVRGALAARGDQRAATDLEKSAQGGNACDKEDIQVRVEALSALAQADMNSATPMLLRVLDRKDACSLELRRRALSILLRRADTAATSAAIRVARNNEENISLRTDAISFLSKLPGDNAIATLQDLMRTSEDANIQRAAVRSLSRSDNARARQSIRALIERSDVSETLRAEALTSFDAERSNGEDAAYLRALYPRLQGERLRSAAISAIARLGGETNERFLLDIARNQSESSETRAAAISRLTRAQSVSIADWQRMYESAESRSIRHRIIQVYQQRTEPEAVDRLVEIIEKGTDPQLRSSALNALKVRDDARAQKLLQAIIDR